MAQSPMQGFDDTTQSVVIAYRFDHLLIVVIGLIGDDLKPPVPNRRCVFQHFPQFILTAHRTNTLHRCIDCVFDTSEGREHERICALRRGHIFA